MRTQAPGTPTCARGAGRAGRSPESRVRAVVLSRAARRGAPGHLGSPGCERRRRRQSAWPPHQLPELVRGRRRGRRTCGSRAGPPGPQPGRGRLPKVRPRGAPPRSHGAVGGVHHEVTPHLAPYRPSAHDCPPSVEEPPICPAIAVLGIKFG